MGAKMLHHSRIFHIVQLLSCVWLFATPWTSAREASLSLTTSWSLPKFTSIASVMPSSRLILWHPLLMPSIFPSIRDFSNESSVCIRWPEYWSFIISPSSEYSGLISLKTDWFDLLPVQGTFRSLLQDHSSKASILGILPSYGPTLTPVHDHWRIFHKAIIIFLDSLIKQIKLLKCLYCIFLIGCLEWNVFACNPHGKLQVSCEAVCLSTSGHSLI